MPSLVWCESVGRNTNLRRHHGLEFVVGNLKESKQFPNQHSNVALVDQGKAEIKRSSANTDIRVAEAVEDGVSMSLNCIRLNSHDFDKSIEGNISNIVVSIREEFSEDIHAKHAETGICFDVQNGEDGFVEDGIANVLG